MSQILASATVSPAAWYATLPAPVLASPPDEQGHARLRRYTGALAEMHKPALSDNLLCMHLGGAKQVRRWQEGCWSAHDVELGSLTVLAAGQANRWVTLGPVDFAHLTLSTALLHQIAAEEFDREPRACELVDAVGVRDPFIERLFRRLLAALDERGANGRLYPDSLMIVLTAALLSDHSTGVARGPPSRAVRQGGLSGWRLRRVIDYMNAELKSDIALAELTSLTGLSRAQFYRAFKRPTGLSPHRYLTRLRLDTAQLLLEAADCDVASVAAAVGIGDGARFSSLFKARFGVTPRLYRLSRA
ncbi:MAG: helix-turn-helix domain-containing protein [Caulobacteraceae bacterium]